ncbi:MAG: hypothetical protein WEA04_03280 [Candidatus Andersenbacteria bacterium]
MDEAEELDVKLREVFPRVLHELAAHQADGFTTAQVREHLEKRYNIPPRLASPQKVAGRLGREVRAGRLRVVTLAGETVNRYLLVTEKTTEGEDMKDNGRKAIPKRGGLESSNNRVELPLSSREAGNEEETPAENKDVGDGGKSERDLDHRIKQMIAYRWSLKEHEKSEAATSEYGCNFSFSHASARREAETDPQAFEQRYNNLKRAMEGLGLMSTEERAKEAQQLVRRAHFSVLQRICDGDKTRAQTVKTMRFGDFRKSRREETDSLIEALRAEGVGVESPPSPLAGIVVPARPVLSTDIAGEPVPVEQKADDHESPETPEKEPDMASAEESEVTRLRQELTRAEGQLEGWTKASQTQLGKITELGQKLNHEKAAREAAETKAQQASTGSVAPDTETKLRHLEQACELTGVDPSALPQKVSDLQKDKADLAEEIGRVGAQPGQLVAHYTTLNDEVVRLRRERDEFPTRLEQAKSEGQREGRAEARQGWSLGNLLKVAALVVLIGVALAWAGDQGYFTFGEEQFDETPITFEVVD